MVGDRSAKRIGCGVLMLATVVLAEPGGAAQAKKQAELPSVPDDWRVEQIAEHPEIKHPSVLAVAPDGRIFVGEDPMDMKGPADQPIDRVLCFHPDGEVTVIAEDLYAVFGMLYLDGRLYVHHPPKLSLFEVENGVGRNRVDLIETTHPKPWSGTSLNDHIPSQIRLAMDGYIYMSVGDKGIYNAEGTDGSTAELHGGGILRFRPDGSDLEVYATGTRNHLDIAVNSQDEMFTYDNTDDGHGWWTRVTHMVDGGYYGYPYDYKPRQPYTLWMMKDYGGGSPTGAIAYTGAVLPKSYHEDLFMCEWGKSEIARFEVSREGASFKIDKRTEFATRGDEEFRPLGIDLGPDGKSFYITDWNYGGWKSDSDAGRLFKITYTGKTRDVTLPGWYEPAAMGRDFEASTSRLIEEGLKHPAKRVRLVAQRRLADQGERAIEPLKRLVDNGGAPAHARWHAIWALDAIDGGKAGREAILRAVDADVLSVQRQAIRQLGTREVSEATDRLIPLVNDSNPTLRFWAATALGRIGDSKAVPALTSGLAARDLFVRYAAFNALNRIGRTSPESWQTIAEGLRNGRRRIRKGTLLAMRETYMTENAKALADFITSDEAGPARARAIEVLAGLHHKRADWDGDWWGTQPIKSAPAAKTEEWAGTRIVLTTLRTALEDPAKSVRLAAVKGLAAAEDVESVSKLRNLLENDPDEEVRQAALQALGDFGTAQIAPLIERIFKSPEANEGLIPDAIDAAEKIGGEAMADALVGLTGREIRASFLVAAMEALGRMESDIALPTVSARLRHPDEAVRKAAAGLLARIGGDTAIEELTRLLEADSPELRRTAVRALGALGDRSVVSPLMQAYSRPETRTVAIEALTKMPDIRGLDAYLDGLESQKATLRQQSRQAIEAIREEALPKIEGKLERSLLSGEVVGALQEIYRGHQAVTHWRLLGPFAKKAEPPFSLNRPSLDEEWTNAEGEVLAWEAVDVAHEQGKVDLTEEIKDTSDVSAFAMTRIEAPAARKTEFKVGSDDGLVLWLNGAKIFEDLGSRGWAPDQFRVGAELRQGNNVLVAKIEQGGGDWAFSVGYNPQKEGPLFEAEPQVLDPAAYADFAENHRGDPEQGKALFMDAASVACIRCHRVEGEGGSLGPDLTNVGSIYSRTQLIRSVLYPSEQLRQGYQATTILTEDGEFIQGVVDSETGETVTVVDAAERERVVEKQAIRERRLSEVSLMPGGLNAALTRKEFADLISYLESLDGADQQENASLE